MKKILSKMLIAMLALTLVIGVGSVGNTASAASKVSTVSGLKVIERDDDELKLKWNKASGAKGYQIYKYNSKTKKWTKIKTTTKRTYEVENLSSATNYKFKVRAYSGSRTGSYSKVLSTYTEPNEVKGVKASSKTTSSITLKWNKVTRATKYQVYMYNSSTGKYVHKTTVTGTSAKISGLSSGTNYKFKVRAVKTVSKTNYYGDFSDSYKVNTSATSSSSSSTSTTDIGAAKAKTIALNNAGVSASSVSELEVEKDKENGVVVYEVSFKYNGYEYDYVINASTGKIIEKEVERD